MQIRSNVHSYDLEWQFDEPLSVHVIETDDGTVLFGGGDTDCAEELADIVERHDVDVVLVEHGDADHFDGIPHLRETELDVEVAVPAEDASALEAAGIEVDRRLEPGESYRGIETIAAPGHTPGNAAYLYEDVLVAGDTVVNANSMFAADDDWSGSLGVVIADYNADDEATRQSVSNLLEYDFETILISHGENVEEDGKDAVETLVADLE